jgi:glutathione S-transferase
MAELPVLYSFRRCPYAMRARMAVAVSGVEVDLREVLLRDKPPEMLIASPKGTVPVLVLPGGTVIDESLDVMQWALARNDPNGWLGAVDSELIAENDGPFKAALDRYKYPYRYGLADGLQHRKAGLEWLMTLDQKLAQHPFLCGDHVSFTDSAIFPFVRQFAATDRDWFDVQPVEAVRLWLDGLVASDLFAGVMVKYPVWEKYLTPSSINGF